MALCIEERPWASGPRPAAPTTICQEAYTDAAAGKPKQIDVAPAQPRSRPAASPHQPATDSITSAAAITHSIPVIDLARLSSDRAGVIVDVGRACEEWGFFQVINHDIPLQAIHNLKEGAKAFFALPLADKLQVKRSFEHALGYNDGELTKNARDWKEVFDIAAEGCLELPAHFHGDHLHTRTTLNQWPSAMPHLRMVIEEYVSATKELAFTLLHLIAQSLGLPPRYFDEHFLASKTVRLRLNHYPISPAPHQLALCIGAHKDTGALTILLQDDVGGLEVKQKDGQWIPVKPNPIAPVINVGDVIQVYSNDKYKSVEHRVLTNKGADRYSFPLFFNPAHWVMVSPIPELIDEEHPPKYGPYNWGKYMKRRMDSNFKHLGVENLQLFNLAIEP
ncbi:hypothetical protein L7F22_024945 [Adiantum nelumboides]|nr:hypothetical protein [Adiantum nelumboides]